MMRDKTIKVLMGLLVMAILVSLAGFAVAEEDDGEEFSVTVLPGRYVSVKGDEKKFRALNWMTDGYAGGIEELLYTNEKDDTYFGFEGRSIPDEIDNKAEIELRQGGVGFLDFHYRSFRKYYDPTGGTFYPMTASLSATDVSQDLEMDISHMSFELGTDVENTSGVSFFYERHGKEGKKSRLTWTSVNNGVRNVKIGPSWQDVDEVTDALALKQRTEIAGVSVKAEQRVEMTKIDSFREERQLASTGVAADTVIRRQKQEPETLLYASNLMGSKWFNDEKTYMSMGYRFQKIDNRETEFIRDFTAANAPVCLGQCKNRIDAKADNELDSHALVSQFMTNPTDHLSLTFKVKGETIDKESSSLYPIDSNNPPDSIANNFDRSNSENEVQRYGQSVGLRYAGLPKTNAYIEADMEQTRNWLSELLVNIPGSGAASASGDFARTTVTHVQKTVVTAGTRSVPTRKLNFTTQFRQKWENNDYDDQYESSGGATARSAFVEELKVVGSEATAKITYKLLKWLEASFRYQFIENEYFTRTDSNNTAVESDLLSHVFTYDLFLTPLANFLVNLSYSFNDMKMGTPAALYPGASAVPGFNADVHSWLMSGSYSINENLNSVLTFNYSKTDNFNDFSATGLPYGSDYDMYSGTLEMNWKMKEDLTLSPHYGYYRYDSNPLIDSGDYSAHAAWLDVKLDW